MIKITKELYQQNIPSCCELKTIEEHEDILMLCWGLCHAIENNEVMNCSGCEFNEEKV